MRRMIIVPVVLALGAAHCTARTPQEQPPAAPAPPPPPVTELAVPKGFMLEHFGRGDTLRRIVQVQYPEAHQQWSDGDLIVVSGANTPCFLVRLGHRIERLTPCPGLDASGGEKRMLALKPTRWGRALTGGRYALPASKAAGAARVTGDALRQLLRPLGLPDVEHDESLAVSVYGREDGTGFALSFPIAEDAQERLGRFDLARRYGGFVDYVRDVRAWGDGQSFQWILRLDGGGVGVRLDGRQVRIGVQAGAEWKAQLDVLLRATQASAAQIPVLDVPGVALGVEEAVHLRLLAQEKALPTRAILRQLAARLSRWRDREEDEP